jgi:oligopeptide/dipeptide ABC transporter ATP-binding protein
LAVAAGTGADRAPSPRPRGPLLEVRDLSVSFATEEGRVRVVEEVSFALAPGETLGLVGESGCGKSVTALSILGLNPSPPARVDSGAISFEGTDLLRLDPRSLRKVRGEAIGMIFQEPMTSLNPTFTVGFQIAEVLRLHRGASGPEARAAARRMLEVVGVGAADRRLDQYPHELSGGLRQRAMIAMALACRPRLLIADEPTTALDVTIQAQILDLLLRLQAEMGLAVLLITHDLGVVAEVCRTVAVMYAGRIVEAAPAAALFARPRHPYTDGLLRSSPRIGARGSRLAQIPGMVPAPGRRGPGCAFAGRCPRAGALCRLERPPLDAAGDGRHVACWDPL